MVFERLPVFDEPTVVDALDGDRELLFEILGLHRETLQKNLDQVKELAPNSEEFHQTIGKIRETAERIHATRLGELAQLLHFQGPDVDLPRAAKARLIREIERFLRETRTVI